MKLLANTTSRELEAGQLRRAIARTNAEIVRLSTQVAGMAARQARRMTELSRQTP